MKRQNLRTVSLIVVTFTYLLIGAAIFGYLESEHEVRQREHLELIELIVKRKYNISDDDFTVLTTTVIKSVPHKAGIQWKFPGAFYFATTVVTTIGYGHSTPATIAGRSFCMIYALIGIPLGLVMFQSIGERLNTFVGSALRYAKRCYNASNPEVTQTNLVMVVSVLSTILMTSMAAVFAKYERWDYFDALYYCFITLTTIGFGDYVALQKESALQSKPEYVALSLVFILFGLSVVSSAVNLLVLKFLTLNTEDERRDEQLRYTANLNPIQLEGDVITSTQNPSKFNSAAAATGARRRHPASPEASVGASAADEEQPLAAAWLSSSIEGSRRLAEVARFSSPCSQPCSLQEDDCEIGVHECRAEQAEGEDSFSSGPNGDHEQEVADLEAAEEYSSEECDCWARLLERQQRLNQCCQMASSQVRQPKQLLQHRHLLNQLARQEQGQQQQHHHGRQQQQPQLQLQRRFQCQAGSTVGPVYQARSAPQTSKRPPAEDQQTNLFTRPRLNQPTRQHRRRSSALLSQTPTSLDYNASQQALELDELQLRACCATLNPSADSCQSVASSQRCSNLAKQIRGSHKAQQDAAAHHHCHAGSKAVQPRKEANLTATILQPHLMASRGGQQVRRAPETDSLLNMVHQTTRALGSSSRKRSRWPCSISSSSPGVNVATADVDTDTAVKRPLSPTISGDLLASSISQLAANRRTSIRGSGRGKQRLVCKCCCQHGDCIEQALQIGVDNKIRRSSIGRQAEEQAAEKELISGQSANETTGIFSIEASGESSSAAATKQRQQLDSLEKSQSD